MALSSITKPSVLHRLARSFSSTTSLVDLEVNNKNGVATLTFQRPPVNSLNLELLTEFKQHLSNLENTKCRGAIITGASKTFSAGLDIMDMYRPDVERCRKTWVMLQDVYEVLYSSSYPTVAVLNGSAPAGGCLLSVSCEYRIMVPKSIIGINEAQLGMVAPTWFMRTVENTIGKRQAELAITSGRPFTREEAFKIGLVDEIVQNKEEGLVRAQAFLDRYEKIPQHARSLSKQVVRGEALRKMRKERDQDLEFFLQTIQQEAFQKGLGLYLEGLKKKK